MIQIHRPGTRCILLFIGIFLACGVRDVSAQGSYQGVFADRSYRDAAAASRLGRFLSSVDIFDAISPNGYSYRISPLGLTPFESLGPTVVLDGQPQWTDLAGFQQFNLIPLSVDDIDSIYVDTSPADELLFRNPAGTIHIRSKRPLGWTVRSVIDFGNEVNDPGPYRYTDFSSGNIDREGPRVDTRLTWGDGKFFFMGALRLDEFHFTDARLEGRIWSTFAGDTKPTATLEAPEMLFSYAGETMAHQLRWGGAIFSDFLYLDPVGRELPLDMSMAFASFNGRFGRTDGGHILYNFDARRNEAEPADASIEAGGPLEERWVNFSLAYKLVRPIWGMNLGFGYSIIDRISDGAGLADFIRRYRASVGFSFESSENVRHQVKGLVTTPVVSGLSSDNLGYAGSWRTDYSGRSGTLHALVSFSERDPEEIRSLPGQLQRGLTLPFPTLSNVVRTSAFTRDRYLHVELGGATSSNSTVSISPMVAFRAMEGLTLPSYDRTFLAFNGALETETRLHTGISGQVLTTGLSVQHRYSNLLKTNVSWYWTRPITGGNQHFWEHWAPLKGHRAVISTVFTPDPRFRLFARASWKDERLWPVFSGEPGSTRPARLIIDVSAQKDLWDDILSVSVSGTNVGNNAWREHPVGPVENLVFRFAVRVNFSGGSDLYGNPEQAQ